MTPTRQEAPMRAGESKNRRAMARGVLLVFLLAAAGAIASSAQSLYGTLVGSVTDSGGAALPGATVTATNQGTNETRSTTSNESGGYTLSTMPVGTYSVKVEKGGFSAFTQTGVLLTLNTVVRVDAGMKVGAGQTQTVTVSADVAQLQTDRADVHSEISAQSLQELPQPTRTYEGTIGLMPGVAPPSASSGGTNNPMRSMVISANGTSENGTNVRVDGVSATNPWVQFYSTAVPSTDAIQTVNVVTGSADADQGMVNGAAINVQIKSGTNALHGSAYEYHIDNLMKARPYVLPEGTGLPKYLDNDAGGTIGGPILRNRVFFFGSYEGDFLEQGSSNILTVPTAAIRSGDMSGSTTPIYDPETGVTSGSGAGSGRTAFTGNLIPQGRISPIAQKLVALIPQPNLSGVANNYYVNAPQSYKVQKIDTKFDWDITQKLRSFVRVSAYPYDVEQTPEFGKILGGQDYPASQSGNIYAVSASVTYVASQHWVIDGLFGLTHSNQTLTPPSVNQRLGQDYLGIPNTNLGTLPENGGMPQFSVSGYSGYGYSYPALVYNDPVFQYTGNAVWTRGQHTVRFGMDISQQHMNHIETSPTYLSFSGGLTALNQTGAPAPNQYNSFADLLLGLPQNVQNSVQATKYLTLRTWQFSPYVTDQWQVSPKLTVSIGTRWDYYPVPTREDRGIEFYNFATKQYEICGKGSIPLHCGISVQKTLFSPRVGIAFRPEDRSVVRAGFSLAPEQINMARDGIYGYPNELTGNYSGPSSYEAATTLAAGIPALQTVDISSGIVSLPPGVTFSTPPKNFIRGYTESYNLALEHDFGAGWLGEMGYVGTHSVHQHTRYNVNYGLPGGGAASQPFYNGTLGTGITGSETVIYPYESMLYDSLQARLQHRFLNGFQISAAYTWSKWIGICCDSKGDGQPEIPIPQYFSLNRTLMPGDRTHNVEISALLASPFGKNHALLTHGVGAALAGGWQLNTVLSFYSGSPFSVTANGTSLNAPGSTQRADQVKPEVQIYGARRGQSYFDTTAFAAVNEARFGTANFNSLRGPGVANADMSLFRSFTLRERYTAQARFEVLNLTNTPHFSNPDSNYQDGNFGQINSTSAPSRTTDERYVRLGFKFSF